jgi:hypothetical protein
VVIQSEAGIGKSSLAAHLVWTRPCVHHFTRLEGGRNPVEARKSLAAQLLGWWGLTDRFCPDGNLPPVADRPDWLSKILHAAAQQRDAKNPGAPLVLIVDGLDEAEPPASGEDTGIPLGLPRPEHLPAGVHVMVTTRFGVALPSLRNRTEWHVINVTGEQNLADLRTYIATRIAADPDIDLALRRYKLRHDWIVNTLTERCAGVWMYARYVLDEIAAGRDPADVASLPNGLAGFYEEQMQRWSSIHDWDDAGMPLLATLAALLRAAPLDEITALLGRTLDRSRVGWWLDESFRAFLDAHKAHGRRQYAIRHQSLRDLFENATEGVDDAGDDAGLRDRLHDAVRSAHSRIVDALTPSDRRWSAVDAYTRGSLPRHAAGGGRLDGLVIDPGFLLAVEPAALLRYRTHVRGVAASRAIGAYVDGAASLDR